MYEEDMRVSSEPLKCPHCRTTFPTKTILKHHTGICNFIHTSAYEHSIDRYYNPLEVPSPESMVHYLIHLTTKYQELEQRFTKLQASIITTRRKTIQEYLEQLSPPEKTFAEWSNSLEITQSALETVFQNDLKSGIQQVLDIPRENIPIRAFSQKPNIFYLYDTEAEWRQMSADEFTSFINKIERKFLSLNWRYATHRHMIASYLQNYPSYVSWQFKCDFDTLSKNLWFDIEEYRNDYMKQYRKLSLGTILLDKNSPLNLDHSVKQPIQINKWDGAYTIPSYYHTMSNRNVMQSRTGIIASLYNKSFVSIVNESRFAQPTGNYSEKVLQTIFLQHPFILVAPPYTLKYMRETGLKTFSDFWDESYDEEPIHSLRMAKILKLIDYIGSKSLEELEQLRLKMEPILKYNLALLKQIHHTFNLSMANNPIK